MDTLRKRDATNPHVIAKRTDFINMAGRAAAGGIPNNTEFTNGESTAVSNPTRHPYLYEPTKVKKYIGSHVTPP